MTLMLVIAFCMSVGQMDTKQNTSIMIRQFAPGGQGGGGGVGCGVCAVVHHESPDALDLECRNKTLGF